MAYSTGHQTIHPFKIDTQIRSENVVTESEKRITKASYGGQTRRLYQKRQSKCLANYANIFRTKILNLSFGALRNLSR